ncbi:hypothetical protein [Pseudomonas sp. Au-Pse12]|uniref:hypothetical protein n=1 Tax=Pseudomonas sp. Au-Pse12 TaxID=2906459 RepID=UPI001E49D083|nr:hypothetical protein [Pseudomonas sp. Au-Pse12]MCE4057968.1 hypothetical protein [Pseudomonas sp. Au-Pse12]
MKYLLAFLLLSPITCAATVKICSADGPQYFISQWSEDGDPVQVLSRVDGVKFSAQEGRVIYNDDLNGDGVKDFIFSSSGSEGSSKDRVYGFFIQCRGYLKFVGGDYFAGVKVLDISPGGENKYKDIEVYSYQRDKDGNVVYKGEGAVTKSYVWSFNHGAQRYEGALE